MNELPSLVQIREEIENIYNIVSVDSTISLTNSFVVDSETFEKLAIDPSFEGLIIKYIGATSYKEATWRGYSVFTFPNCSKGVYRFLSFKGELKI